MSRKHANKGTSQLINKAPADIADHAKPSFPRDREVAFPDGVKRVSISRMHSGPLPSADELSAYGRAMPGLPERIATMSEKEQDHRHSSDRFCQQQVALQYPREYQLRKTGQNFALITGNFGLLVALLLGLWGNPWVAGTVGTLDIAALAGLFIYGTRKQRELRDSDKNNIDADDSKS